VFDHRTVPLQSAETGCCRCLLDVLLWFIVCTLHILVSFPSLFTNMKRSNRGCPPCKESRHVVWLTTSSKARYCRIDSLYPWGINCILIRQYTVDYLENVLLRDEEWTQTNCLINDIRHLTPSTWYIYDHKVSWSAYIHVGMQYEHTCSSASISKSLLLKEKLVKLELRLITCLNRTFLTL